MKPLDLKEAKSGAAFVAESLHPAISLLRYSIGFWRGVRASSMVPEYPPR